MLILFPSTHSAAKGQCTATKDSAVTYVIPFLWQRRQHWELPTQKSRDSVCVPCEVGWTGRKKISATASPSARCPALCQRTLKKLPWWAVGRSNNPRPPRSDSEKKTLIVANAETTARIRFPRCLRDHWAVLDDSHHEHNSIVSLEGVKRAVPLTNHYTDKVRGVLHSGAEFPEAIPEEIKASDKK